MRAKVRVRDRDRERALGAACEHLRSPARDLLCRELDLVRVSVRVRDWGFGVRVRVKVRVRVRSSNPLPYPTPSPQAMSLTGWCLMLQRAAALDGLVRPISRACSPCAWCTW